MRKRRPCIGLCHLNRVAKAKVEIITTFDDYLRNLAHLACNLQGLPGFLWKHPKQEAKERKEKESMEKEKKERLEKEKKKASETVETGKEMSTSKN